MQTWGCSLCYHFLYGRTGFWVAQSRSPQGVWTELGKGAEVEPAMPIKDEIQPTKALFVGLSGLQR